MAGLEVAVRLVAVGGCENAGVDAGDGRSLPPHAEAKATTAVTARSPNRRRPVGSQRAGEWDRT
jgi:hypothetical protein